MEGQVPGCKRRNIVRGEKRRTGLGKVWKTVVAAHVVVKIRQVSLWREAWALRRPIWSLACGGCALEGKRGSLVHGKR